MKKYLQVFVLSTLSTFAYAQDEKPEKPKTKLEAFMAQDGTVIVQGFSTIGKMEGMYGSFLSVDSKEITVASSGKREYGITIEVKKNIGSNLTRESTSYIDYDEIESLLKGIDYISKIDKSSTKLQDFQADYRTKDDLKISVFSGSLGLFSSSKNSSIYLNVESGIIGRATATFKLESINEFRGLIAKAKEKLDSIK
ncbi:hypothetical protein [Spirosoma agri]|uniref:Uncharacterized protein n=1 Tax=Spirosoma agri TaxID=1987381 RepID=A0A6M0IHS4_9BACT|nr:hypothetical protein [Spirosoma agri]NEU67778.1 hypothetical protein [Spirosoma agri]